MVTKIEGGVCAPLGFTASGLHSGIAKDPAKKDLALIYSSVEASAAAVYTKNKVKASPLLVTQKHIASGKAQAIICNSGNANCCNADGYEVAEKMCQLAAGKLHCNTEDILVASTGVIGKPLPIEPVEGAVMTLVGDLSDKGSADCVHAIMTTDTTEKEISVSFDIGGTTCHMGAVAKGSGMIHPNMGTMLSFITTDVAIAPPVLQKVLSMVVEDTFNMVSVDGDTSTNDMAVILANGMAHNSPIVEEDENCTAFLKALMYVCIYLARSIAADGEGATKLLECRVSGAPNDETARVLSKSVISSSLFKAAMFGADANWGRVLCALGYAEAEFDITKTALWFASHQGKLQVCKDGAGIPFDEDIAKRVLSAKDIEIIIELDQGSAQAVAWGCDLTYDYVKINGDYRS